MKVTITPIGATFDECICVKGVERVSVGINHDCEVFFPDGSSRYFCQMAFVNVDKEDKEKGTKDGNGNGNGV